MNLNLHVLSFLLVPRQTIHFVDRQIGEPLNLYGHLCTLILYRDHFLQNAYSNITLLTAVGMKMGPGPNQELLRLRIAMVGGTNM